MLRSACVFPSLTKWRKKIFARSKVKRRFHHHDLDPYRQSNADTGLLLWPVQQQITLQILYHS